MSIRKCTDVQKILPYNTVSMMIHMYLSVVSYKMMIQMESC